MTGQNVPSGADYTRVKTARLRERLEAVKASLRLIREEFGGWPRYEWIERALHNDPFWEGWENVEMPEHMYEVRRLEAERQKIALELSKRDQNSTDTQGRFANRRQAKRSDPDFAERRAIVWSNPDLSAGEMCELFDRRNITLPPKWEAAGFQKWSRAYKDPKYRPRIDTLISKDRRTKN